MIAAIKKPVKFEAVALPPHLPSFEGAIHAWLVLSKPPGILPESIREEGGVGMTTPAEEVAYYENPTSTNSNVFVILTDTKTLN